MAIYHLRTKVISRSVRSTVAAVAYRSGTQIRDEKTGEQFDYRHKKVESVELLLANNAPAWAKEIQKEILENRQLGVQKLNNIVERFEKRTDAQVWREIEFALPRELNNEQGLKLAKEYLTDQFCGLGMGVLMNAHMDICDKTGERKPHIHALLTMRPMTKTGFDLKNREWNKKDLHENWREQWARYANYHLTLNGYESRIDHRSYEARGIDLIPQPKLGKNVLEMERRSAIKKGELDQNPVTDKGKNWTWVDAKNTYTILKNPEEVFRILTSKQSTFTWNNVTDVTKRYVKDEGLRGRVESLLKASDQLIMLSKSDKNDTKTGQNTSKKDQNSAVFTSASYAKKEDRLSLYATALGRSTRHGVSHDVVSRGLDSLNKKLGDLYGSSLSVDQEKALKELCSEGQLKTVVGYAGAGKSTVLGGAKDIWEDGGFRVYGLAPTGRAASTLSQEGIESKTLFKFLKDYDQGRCQYSKNSVLVLDEGGMVPVWQMEKFLAAVKDLKVKAVVVGDPNQLQPIEAGDAFRLVTDIVSPSVLSSVIRQSEDWMREATKLFGDKEADKALTLYAEKGHVHLIESDLPSLSDLEKRVSDAQGDLSHESKASIVSDLQALQGLSNRAYQLTHSRMCWDFYRTAKKPDFRYFSLHKDYEVRGAWEALKDRSETLLDFLGEKPLSVKEVDLMKAPRDALLESWKKDFVQTDQSILMMSTRRYDVDALNSSAKAFLQKAGKVGSEGYAFPIEREHRDDFGRLIKDEKVKEFSLGDQIIFLKNQRSLDVKNGHMATIIGIDKQKIQAELKDVVGADGKSRVVSFAPNLYKSFDHGWAATIHKNQGATCDKAYYLASPTDSRNLSYVAMTRHKKDVQLFGSKELFTHERGVSVHLSQNSEKLLARDYTNQLVAEYAPQSDGQISKALQGLSNRWEGLKYITAESVQLIKEKYLGYERDAVKEPQKGSESVSTFKDSEAFRAHTVLEGAPKKAELSTFLKNEQERAHPERSLKQIRLLDGVRGEETIMSQDKIRQKESSDPSRVNASLSQGAARPKVDAPQPRLDLSKSGKMFDDRSVEDILKTVNTADFSRSLLGTENKALSNNRQLRFGSKGSVMVNIAGAKEGLYYNFETGKGGSLITMAMEEGGASSKKDAIEMVKDFSGDIDYTPRISTKDSSLDNPLSADKAEDQERSYKIQAVNKIHSLSKDLSHSVADRYLTEHRCVTAAGLSDVRSLSSFKDHRSGHSSPAMVVFARDEKNTMTGCQITYLDSQTGGKNQEMDVVKRSRGIIKGSSVLIQKGDESSKTLFVAEGVETALSIRQAGVKGDIKATLGVSNMESIAKQGDYDRIVICADAFNKGESVEKIYDAMSQNLKDLGKEVHLIEPYNPTLKSGYDFNNSLQDHGFSSIRSFLIEKGFEGLLSDKVTLSKDQFDLEIKHFGLDQKEVQEFKDMAQEQGASEAYAYLESRKMTKHEQMEYHADQEKRETILYFEESVQGFDNGSKEMRDHIQELYDKSHKLEDSVAEEYLTKTCRLGGDVPHSDLRALEHYVEGDSGETVSALLAFSRDKEGDIAGVQITCLDPQTSDVSHDVEHSQKDFGTLTNHSLVIQEGTKENNTLILTSEVEDALILKNMGLKGEIHATFTPENMENVAKELNHDQVILVTDYEAPDSSFEKAYQEIIQAIEETGINVERVTPFNPENLSEYTLRDSLEDHGIASLRFTVHEQLGDGCLTDTIHLSRAHFKEEMEHYTLTEEQKEHYKELYRTEGAEAAFDKLEFYEYSKAERPLEEIKTQTLEKDQNQQKTSSDQKEEEPSKSSSYGMDM